MAFGIIPLYSHIIQLHQQILLIQSEEHKGYGKKEAKKDD